MSEAPFADRFCEKHGYSYTGDRCPSCARYEQGATTTSRRFDPVEYRRWLRRWLTVGFNSEWPQTHMPGGTNRG